jgi:hypothetical protein
MEWRSSMKWCAALVFVSASVALAAPDGGAVSCVEVEQKLAAAQRTLTACTEGSRSVAAARERCEAELQDSGERLQSTQARVDTCVQEQTQLCQSTAVFAASLLTGSAPAVNGCLPASTQQQVQGLLTAWSVTTRSLAQLDDFLAGAIDSLPRPTGATEAERRLQHILGGKQGTPAWNRRLLIVALRLTAPNTWASLQRQGLPAIEAFFGTRGPLPKGFIEEANGEHEGPAGPAGPPLTAALRLVLSYLEMADCENRSDSTECGRARQLLELLDDTGPLIIRRRVEEMWATPCDALSPDTVRAWLQEFPSSGRKEKEQALKELTRAASSKLFVCFLADAEGDPSYRAWVAPRLPAAKQVEARNAAPLDAFLSHVKEGDVLDRCGRAVRAMQRLGAPTGCAIDKPETLTTLSTWARQPLPPGASDDGQLCQKVATLLFSGAAVDIPTSPGDEVKTDAERTTVMGDLRKACDERVGLGPAFEQGLLALHGVAKDLGETASASPWRLDVTSTRPVERARFEGAETYGGWLQHLLDQEGPAATLGLSQARVEGCREQPDGSRYDCALMAVLEATWLRYRRVTAWSAVGLFAVVVVAVWLNRQRRERSTYSETVRTVRESLAALGLSGVRDSWRFVFPSRHDTLILELPKTPAWERWGQAACAVYSADGAALREADVNHAAQVALREDVRVVFLLHADSAVPDLGAVRGTLDWAARGGTRAVTVLPLALSRLAWATKDEDLLDLVEATTLRGNPFEVRGPVRSSSQFWNRERLVAGLLTEARKGNWMVVTGLRRFGKSSLALEVARRMTGPSAYVDLAGFHHEVSYGETPAVAVEAILRTLVTRLSDSAAARYPAATVPALPTGALDAPALAAWLRALTVACGQSSGTAPPPVMLVLDEVEQLLSAPPEKLGRALDVMATLTGRLRSALAEPSSPHAGSSVSVVLCAAMHPLLWAPLSTLGGQSIMGAFPSLCVPALDDEAAHAMMRGLGSRQGIRFDDDALSALVKASHGVPLLLRRLGTSVLELYDADRARQGSLGAMRIGVEGAREAIKREEKGGSPLRVWVESEIAQEDTSPGVLLRAVSSGEPVKVKELETLLEGQVLQRFAVTGLTGHLSPSELKRRAQEAASVMVRLMAESKLLEAHGDLTSPDAYSLPDGVLRRILREARRVEPKSA